MLDVTIHIANEEDEVIAEYSQEEDRLHFLTEEKDALEGTDFVVHVTVKSNTQETNMSHIVVDSNIVVLLEIVKDVARHIIEWHQAIEESKEELENE